MAPLRLVIGSSFIFLSIQYVQHIYFLGTIKNIKSELCPLSIKHMSLRLTISDHYRDLLLLMSQVQIGVRSSERHVHTEMNLSFS